MKYTEDDVIWKRTDSRIRIHMKCKAGLNPYDVIQRANNNPECQVGELLGVHATSSAPFFVRFGDDDMPRMVSCIICIDKVGKKIVPFDFSLKEDRDALRDKWIVDKETEAELKIDSFREESDFTGEECGWCACSFNPEVLFERFVFLDTGDPVGKEVDE